eukprot:6208976-Pleurochrysis_carterae.AAC.1
MGLVRGDAPHKQPSLHSVETTVRWTQATMRSAHPPTRMRPPSPGLHLCEFRTLGWQRLPTSQNRSTSLAGSSNSKIQHTLACRAINRQTGFVLSGFLSLSLTHTPQHPLVKAAHHKWANRQPLVTLAYSLSRDSRAEERWCIVDNAWEAGATRTPAGGSHSSATTRPCLRELTGGRRVSGETMA